MTPPRKTTRKGWGKQRSRPSRSYRKLIIIAAEGTVTEPQYFDMFNDQQTTVRIEHVKASTASAPANVLKRARAKLAKESLNKHDRIWLVVDRDDWPEAQLKECLKWVNEHPEQRGLALSNPCFELWLLLHLDDAAGRSTHAQIRQALKNHLPNYNKTIDSTKFSKQTVLNAIDRAKQRDTPPTKDWPQTVGSTVYRIIGQIQAT
ncbi:MAG: RloB domain-containing protein [Sphaerospermopsis sp. SIO1G2]|nr:RloB domain-containing protein [Sphaerospermopsis sp. SIO1G2]